MSSYRRVFMDGFVYAIRLVALWIGVAAALTAMFYVMLWPALKGLFQ